MIFVGILSLVVNVILLYLLMLRRAARRYIAVMADGEDGVHIGTRPGFRRYGLYRMDDVSGVSGTGLVCEVAEFSDGHAALHWLGRYPTTTPVPQGIRVIVKIHGHGGKTRLVSLDTE